MITLRRSLVVLGGTLVFTLSGGPSALTLGVFDPGADRAGADALTRASAAALTATGGGRVTATEVDAEESCYEVLVTLGNGRQIDVEVDENFTVVESSHTTDAADAAAD